MSELDIGTEIAIDKITINSENNEKTKKTIPLKYDEINVPISRRNFDIVKKGMFLVVHGAGTGTALKIPDVQFAGKTGTAQNPHGKDHALFIAFAPYDNPKIAVAVIVENVGYQPQRKINRKFLC